MRHIWVGKRESDIQTYPFFDYSITFWGSNENGNRSFNTERRVNANYSSEFIDYVIEELDYISSQEKKYSIQFYNNTIAYKLLIKRPNFRDYIININPQSIHRLLRHKSLSRLWLSNTVETPAFASLSPHEIEFDRLCRMFPGHDRFILQSNYSGGGEGTYVLSESSIKTIIDSLPEYEAYLVSPYYEPCISINSCAIIDERSQLLLPVSTQYTKSKDDLRYAGNNFNIDYIISKQINQETEKVCNTIRNTGYRGICGFDWIIYKNRVLLIEINPRFQGSSCVINLALHDNNFPSLFELNTMSFAGTIPDRIKDDISNLRIFHEIRILFADSLSSDMPESYLYRFTDGLSSVSFNNSNVYMYKYIL